MSYPELMQRINCLADHSNFYGGLLFLQLSLDIFLELAVQSSAFEVFQQQVNALRVIKDAVKFDNVLVIHKTLNLYLKDKLVDHEISFYCAFRYLFEGEYGTCQLVDCYPNHSESSFSQFLTQDEVLQAKPFALRLRLCYRFSGMLGGRNDSDCMMSFLQRRNVSIDWSFYDRLRGFFPELNGRNDAQSSIRDRLSWWRFLLLFLLEALIEIFASLKNHSIFLILLLLHPSDICSGFGSSIHCRTFNLQAIYRIIVFFHSSISQFFQFLDLLLNVIFASKGSQLRTGL